MDMKNGVKNIRAAAYNGARTVFTLFSNVIYEGPSDVHPLMSRFDVGNEKCNSLKCVRGSWTLF